MNFSYSKSTNAFYDNTLKAAYKENGNWPEDCKEVDDDTYFEFRSGVNEEGMIRGSNQDGLPAWVEAPPLSNEALTTIAVDRRDTLMRLATKEIEPLQDAVDTGDASQADNEALLKWKIFRRDLNRIDQQEGWPANILWPEQP
ncbi:Caudovirales tail fiber assembly protein [compost metagenome]